MQNFARRAFSFKLLRTAACSGGFAFLLGLSFPAMAQQMNLNDILRGAGTTANVPQGRAPNPAAAGQPSADAAANARGLSALPAR